MEVIESKCLKRKKLKVKKSLGDTAFHGKEMNRPKWWLRRRKQTRQTQRDGGRRRRAAQLAVMPQRQSSQQPGKEAAPPGLRVRGRVGAARAGRCSGDPHARCWLLEGCWEPGSDFFRTPCREESGGMQGGSAHAPAFACQRRHFEHVYVLGVKMQ